MSVRSSAAGHPPAASPAPTAGPAPAAAAEPAAAELATPSEPAFGDRTPVPWQPPDGCVFSDLLRTVIDPELGVNIVDLGLVYDVRVRDGTARVWMTMTTPGCPLGAYFDDEIRAALGDGPGVEEVDLRIVWEPPWRPEMMNDVARRQLGWSG